MPESLEFFADEQHIQSLGSVSGLAFMGAAWGYSIPVGEWNRSTWISSPDGINQGPQSNNTRWAGTGTLHLNEAASAIPLTAVPNYQAPFNSRFQFDSPVRVENVRLYIYDRTSLNNPPSGVTCRVAEVVHPGNIQTNDGSGHTLWHTPAGTGYLPLSNSPGTSGLKPNGDGTLDTRHDHYLLLTASPDTVGSKALFGLALSLEYY